jgi:hypothetical protein
VKAERRARPSTREDLQARAERQIDAALSLAPADRAAAGLELRAAQWTLARLEYAFGVDATAWAAPKLDRVAAAISAAKGAA